MKLNIDDPVVFEILVRVCSQYQTTVFLDRSRKPFYVRLVEAYPGPLDMAEFEEWLNHQIPDHFLSYGERPRWIQGKDWPFSREGHPMIFVGQIDVSVVNNPVAAHHFHDDVSFYVFLPNGDGTPTVVIQEY